MSSAQALDGYVAMLGMQEGRAMGYELLSQDDLK
jgi:hypothetical protein